MPATDFAEMLKSFVSQSYTANNPLTFNEYNRLVLLASAANPNWRLGQTMMNVLYQFRPDIAKLANDNRDTERAFTDDTQSPALVAFVEQNW